MSLAWKLYQTCISKAKFITTHFNDTNIRHLVGQKYCEHKSKEKTTSVSKLGEQWKCVIYTSALASANMQKLMLAHEVNKFFKSLFLNMLPTEDTGLTVPQETLGSSQKAAASSLHNNPPQHLASSSHTSSSYKLPKSLNYYSLQPFFHK